MMTEHNYLQFLEEKYKIPKGDFHEEVAKLPYRKSMLLYRFMESMDGSPQETSVDFYEAIIKEGIDIYAYRFRLDEILSLGYWVENYLKQYETHTILDLGCGSGYLSNYLALKYPKCELQGWDNSPLSIQKARSIQDENQCRNLSFYERDASQEQDLSSFDLIFDALTMQYVLEYGGEKVIQNLYRSLVNSPKHQRWISVTNLGAEFLAEKFSALLLEQNIYMTYVGFISYEIADPEMPRGVRPIVDFSLVAPVKEKKIPYDTLRGFLSFVNVGVLTICIEKRVFVREIRETRFSTDIDLEAADELLFIDSISVFDFTHRDFNKIAEKKHCTFSIRRRGKLMQAQLIGHW